MKDVERTNIVVKRGLKKPKKPQKVKQTKLSRVPITDQIPSKKPRWLWTKYTPKNDGQFKVTPDYPELIDSDVLKGKIKKRQKKDPKKNTQIKRSR